MSDFHSIHKQTPLPKDAPYSTLPQAASPTRKTALLLSIFLLAIAAISILWIIIQDTAHTRMIAEIYQNGERIHSIPLTTVTDIYSFTVTGDNGAENTIEVRQGSIGIISANCPDKLCVHQGFISNSRLPITCLPNRLVIQLRAEETNSEITPDIITY